MVMVVVEKEDEEEKVEWLGAAWEEACKALFPTPPCDPLRPAPPRRATHRNRLPAARAEPELVRQTPVERRCGEALRCLVSPGRPVMKVVMIIIIAK
ncbi:hypothetical protein E2C01_017551 [Portunus trituberculatus]|uniref:Uncharacterized protein n=1 Tax=Portunus trituberculatus TaxID=210409 RepID=A0A5B7DSS5_PORTR|nr:hypothetical protein [Portunus trituberculatus]